ncbi:MAG: hypothetical protein ACK4F8_02290 [Aquabacterium sp.]
MSHHSFAATAAMALALTLSACGGGTDSSTTPAGPSGELSPPAQAASAPGGSYVGYYEEDSQTNPEDPTVGAIAMKLPDGNAPFAGAMYFTYFGCQNDNVGYINGNKTNGTIAGNWNGVLDTRTKNGAFEAAYNEAAQQFTGTFTVAGPKERIDVACGDTPLSYYVAPNGTFELFPQDSSRPASFSVTVQDGKVRWSANENDDTALVYVADPDQLTQGGSPILWQALEIGRTSLSPHAMQIAIGDTLTPDKTYLAVVVLLNDKGERIAFGSKSFKP